MDNTMNNPPMRRRPIRSVIYEEYSAPNGDATVGVLKLVGILCLIAGILLAVIMIVKSMDAALKPIYDSLLMIAGVFFLEGVTLCALFFAIALIVENLVAIRQNTAHLAGIRGNEDIQTQMMQQDLSGY